MNNTPHFIKTIFFAAIALLLSIAVVLYIGIQNLINSYSWVNHTWEVQYKVQNVFAGLKNAESGVRAYLISGDTTYLEDRKQFKKSFPHAVKNLQTLVSDNPSQVKNMQHFDHLIRLRLLLMDTTVSLRQQGITIEQQQVRLTKGRQVMMRVQFLADMMQQIENNLLSLRERNKDRYTKEVPVYLALLTMLALAVLILIFLQLLRQLQTLEKAQLQLQDNNKHLEAQKRALEATNEELESFNYIASHDLKEPLRKILTFSSMIQREDLSNLSEKGKHNFERLQASATKMQALLDDLLAYTRLNASDEKQETVSLEAIANQVIEGMQEMITETGALVETRNLPEIKGIQFQLEQLIENLLNNAIKYRRLDVTPKVCIKGSVVPASEIAAANPRFAQYHLIIFEDNGIGFPQEYAHKAFDIFTRLHNDPQRTGTGVGLTICKKIVENHEGFIQVKSHPGTGTSFFIYLPKWEN